MGQFESLTKLRPGPLGPYFSSMPKYTCPICGGNLDQPYTGPVPSKTAHLPFPTNKPCLKRKGGPIKNLDLVQELLALHRAHPRSPMKWIAAHSGNLWNEYADSLATAWRRKTL